MTYVIDGYLVRRDLPEKFMNTFVDFSLGETVQDNSTQTHRKYVTTNSERFAHWLNKRGHNLVWNDDLERAYEMCATKKQRVSKTKFMTPREGWDVYLNGTFLKSRDKETLDGELRIWEETRLPTPWLYLAAFGTLNDVYVFRNGEFIIEPTVNNSGKISETGLVIDTPLLFLGYRNRKTATEKVRYRSF